jgi:hypothetical protein
VITFTGHREGDKAYVAVSAQRDPALAARFAPTPAAPAVPATPANPSAAPAANAATAAAPVPTAEKPATEDKTTERIASRAQGVEFEIPVYKYEAIFKPYDELLEKPAPKSAK